MAELAKEIIRVNIEDEMRQSYLDYAMSVIVGRALPDVRDGLKPVHRRVLYGMQENNNVWNRAYVKCARVVDSIMIPDQLPATGRRFSAGSGPFGG